MKRELITVGDCPVCSNSGAILVFRAIGRQSPVFFCPMCEVAWPKPPEPDSLDDIISLGDLAPEGITLPSDPEVAWLRRQRIPFESADWEDWDTLLEDQLVMHKET